ncbi:diguanylate cyclase/phosphodiesterase (GGDEF & EAL domains) with PAS/PAC sensor(s) [Olavius sp. associated proteobacterium Delta 1]|nr:diguanylate cyclase/phosphodiesterase (GGDEF & EAL domains) with PAS/PAC sensor(s) [Olavius sp. associated proteobacterium Delta 1]
MNASIPDNNAKNDPGSEKLSIGEYGPRVSELTELLSACRDLSDILNPEELYAIFVGIIKHKFKVHRLGLFVYDPETETFSLVFSDGLGKLEYKFKIDMQDLWQTILQDEPFAVVDDSGNPLFTKFLEKQDLEILPSELWVPLVMRGEVMGLLTLGSKAGDQPFDDFELYFLQQITAQAAVSINTCRLYERRRQEKEDLDKTLQNLSLLYGIGKAMNYISDLKKLLQYILKQAIDIASAEKGSLMLYDIESDRLKIRVLAGLVDTAYQDRVNNNEIKCRSFKPGEGIAGRVFLNSQPMIVNNIRDDSLFIKSETSFVRSIACIPMVVYNDVIGVINVTNKKNGKEFNDQDIKMLKAVADQAAVAVNKAQLWDMAVTDSLTGLYVRRYFMVKLQEEIHRAERYHKQISVIMTDLDRFKYINDSYGHDAGDRALKAISQFLIKNIRDVDAIARYGGEEFVMLIPDADKEEAFRLAERLREELGKVKLDNLPPITMSLGIATYPTDCKDMEELINKADAAMYAAKQAGRNISVKYSEHIQIVRDKDGSAMADDSV